MHPSSPVCSLLQLDRTSQAADHRTPKMAALQQALLGRISSGSHASCSSQDARSGSLTLQADLRAINCRAQKSVRTLQAAPLRAVRADKAADALDQATIQLIADISKCALAWLHTGGAAYCRTLPYKPLLLLAPCEAVLEHRVQGRAV